MGYRINERNIGDYTLEGELKKRSNKVKKVSRTFTEKEITMFNYLMNQISENIRLDATDMDDQVYRDNGNILIQFSRDNIWEFRSLLEKF